MCLAIPGKIITIDMEAEPRMGTVDFGGVRKQVCLEILPEAEVGNYVVVHVGFALSIIDEEEALATLKMFEEMGEDPGEEMNPPTDPRR